MSLDAKTFYIFKIRKLEKVTKVLDKITMAHTRLDTITVYIQEASVVIEG